MTSAVTLNMPGTIDQRNHRVAWLEGQIFLSVPLIPSARIIDVLRMQPTVIARSEATKQSPHGCAPMRGLLRRYASRNDSGLHAQYVNYSGAWYKWHAQEDLAFQPCDTMIPLVDRAGHVQRDRTRHGRA